MNSQKGFGFVGISIVIVGVSLFLSIALYGFGRVSVQNDISTDAETSENMEAVRQRLSEFVTASKTIPISLKEEYGVTYARKDNQTAEMCATFGVSRGSKNDNFISPADIYNKYFGSGSETIYAYRDNVDFYSHKAGRTCYQISYDPINVAYEEQFRGDDKNWQYCDALRQYYGRFTGQTIQGFVIGGSFTTNPGTAGGRAILARDVDAYDESCVKIPVSDLKVGDKVEFGMEEGPINNGEKIYYVKAIKKTP